MQTQTYSCENLSEAAYLIAWGIDPIETKEKSPGRSIWIFERSSQLDKHQDDHTHGRGAAGLVKRFMQARRRLLNETAERAS